MNFQIPEPAAKRTTLVKIAGLMWLIVGFFLLFRGFSYLINFSTYSLVILIFAVLAGYLKARFIFYKIISKNIERIKQLAPEKEKICIFAFQAIQSYLIVIFMILLGWFLRFISLEINLLSFIYILIGFALFISSIKYFQSIKQFTRQEDNQHQTPSTS